MTLSMGPGRLPSARVLVGLLVAVACSPLVASAAKYGGGSGTPQDPYLIRTTEEFAMIGASPADWSMHFKLVNDIDLSGYDEKNLHMIGHWVALGSNVNQPFHGGFDGNGRTISGFRYKNTQEEYIALFQHVTGEIKNLHVAHATVIANKTGAGALVGYLEKGFVIDCSATRVNVSGNWGVGGMVGYVDGTLHRCWSDGEVEGSQYVGGLVGQIGEGTVAHSYSKAKVIGGESVGGLLGGTTGQMCLVDACYATGAVEGIAYVGGLVGQLSAGKVSHCYSIGRVTGTQAVGGLVGAQRVLADVLGSLWDTQTSGQATSAAGAGGTTAEMKSIDPYLTQNWNFAATWGICEGAGYPIFLWQIPVGDLRCPDGVNFTDFVWFAAGWLHDDCRESNYSCEGADLDKSGDVGPQDLALFAANWLAGID